MGGQLCDWKHVGSPGSLKLGRIDELDLLLAVVDHNHPRREDVYTKEAIDLGIQVARNGREIGYAGGHIREAFPREFNFEASHNLKRDIVITRPRGALLPNSSQLKLVSYSAIQQKAGAAPGVKNERFCLSIHAQRHQEHRMHHDDRNSYTGRPTQGVWMDLRFRIRLGLRYGSAH